MGTPIKAEFNTKNSSGGVDTYYFDNYASQVHLTAISGLTATTAQAAFSELLGKDIYRGNTEPTGAANGAIWLDTSDNTNSDLNYVKFSSGAGIVYDGTNFITYAGPTLTGAASAGLAAKNLITYQKLQIWSGSLLNCGYMEYFTNSADSTRTGWIGFGSSGSNVFSISNEKGKSLFQMNDQQVYMGPSGTVPSWYGIATRDDSKIGNSSHTMHVHFDNSNNNLRVENLNTDGTVTLKADDYFVLRTVNYSLNSDALVVSMDKTTGNAYFLRSTGPATGLSTFTLDGSYDQSTSTSTGGQFVLKAYGATNLASGSNKMIEMYNPNGPFYIANNNAYPTYLGGSRLEAPTEVYASLNAGINRCGDVLAGHKIAYSGTYTVLGYGPTTPTLSDIGNMGSNYNGMTIPKSTAASFVVANYDGSWHLLRGFSIGSWYETDARPLPKSIVIETSITYDSTTDWKTVYSNANCDATIMNKFIPFTSAQASVRRVRASFIGNDVQQSAVTAFRVYGSDFAGDFYHALAGARQASIPSNLDYNSMNAFADIVNLDNMTNGPGNQMADTPSIQKSGVIETKITAANQIKQTITSQVPTATGVPEYGYERMATYDPSDGSYGFSNWYLTPTETPFRAISTINGATAYGTNVSNVWGNPVVKKMGNVIYLGGLINIPSTFTNGSLVIATIPEAFRPAKSKCLTVWSLTVATRLDIDTSGNVRVYNYKGTALEWISLDGISYIVGPYDKTTTP